MAVFTTPVLKVSSMTGRPSNGNKYRHTGGVTPTLDQHKLKDVAGKCTYLSFLDIMFVIHVPKRDLSAHGRGRL